MYFKNNAIASTKKRNMQGCDKSLTQPVRKQSTATKDFEFHISYLQS